MKVEKEPQMFTKTGGDCGDVLLVWFSDDDQQDSYESAGKQAAKAMGMRSPVLIGDGWIANPSDGSSAALKKVQKKVGGKIEKWG